MSEFTAAVPPLAPNKNPSTTKRIAAAHPMKPSLDAAHYHEQVRLPRFNRPVCVLSAGNPADAAKLLRRLAQELSTSDHLQLAKAHAEAAEGLDAEWTLLADKAAKATFGRPFHFGDYRVSGIASDQFPDAMKTKLRFAAHASSNHKNASRAHWAAATRRRYPY